MRLRTNLLAGVLYRVFAQPDIGSLKRGVPAYAMWWRSLRIRAALHNDMPTAYRLARTVISVAAMDYHFFTKATVQMYKRGEIPTICRCRSLVQRFFGDLRMAS